MSSKNSSVDREDSQPGGSQADVLAKQKRKSPDSVEQKRQNESGNNDDNSGDEEEQEDVARGLTESDKEDFREAFYHYFINTTSPVPLTVTAKELGFVFRHLGQKVSQAELNDMLVRHGARVHFGMAGNVVGIHARNSVAFAQAANLEALQQIQLQQQQQAQQQQQQQRRVHPAGSKFGSAAALQAGTTPRKSLSKETSAIHTAADRTPAQSRPSTCERPGPYILTWDQFIELMESKLKSDDSVAALEQAFDVFDVKRKGFIMSKELKLYMTMLGESRLSVEEVDRMIEEADEDGSGSIDRAEFVEMLRK